MDVVYRGYAWLAANAPGVGQSLTHIHEFHLPPGDTLANISIARHIAPASAGGRGTQIGPEGGVATDFFGDFYGALEAYIWSWWEYRYGGDIPHLFPQRGEPSAMILENCTSINFALTAENRSGIATATILQFK